MAVDLLTVETITSLFLYGTTTAPEDVELRLRSTVAPAELDVDVDIFSYMSGPGRYASIFQTDVVKKFFAGELSATAFQTDADGNKVATLSDLMAAGLVNSSETRVSVSQYSTDMQSADWPNRAFVFGSTSFVLNDETKFVIGEHGAYIKGGVMLPYDTNFDLETTNPLVQLFNDNVLKDALDPYDIGRKVNLNFSEASKATWRVAHADDVVTSLDAPSAIVDFASGVLHYANIDPAVGVLATGDLLQRVWDSAKYVDQGHNVVFGSNADDIMDSSSVKGWGVDHALPNMYIGGEGADVITTSSVIDGEIVYGGAHNDTITLAGSSATAYGGYGSDTIYTQKFATVDGGDDDDIIHVSGGANLLTGGGGNDHFVFAANQTRAEEADSITDAAAGDRIVFGTTTLTGGVERLAPIYGDTYYQMPWGQEHQLQYAEEAAVYGQDFMGGFQIEFKGGHQVSVWDYDVGDAGIIAGNGRVVEAQDVRPYLTDNHGGLFKYAEYTDMWGTPQGAMVYDGLGEFKIVDESIPM